MNKKFEKMLADMKHAERIANHEAWDRANGTVQADGCIIFTGAMPSDWVRPESKWAVR